MNRILYNKDWTEQTAQQIKKEQQVCRMLTEQLQNLRNFAATGLSGVDDLVYDSRKLETSLEVTWTVLEQYSEDMQRTNSCVMESIEEAETKAKKVFA